MIRRAIKNGFTLVEVIIYIAFVSIVATVYVTYAVDVLTSVQKARLQQEVQQNARLAMERMLQEIRAAEGINVGSSTFGSHPGMLSLATATPATNPTVFDVSGGVLRMTQGVGAAVPLTSDTFDVTNLVFSNLSISNRTTNIRVSLTLEHPNPENNEVFDASTVMRGAAAVRELVD